MSAIKCANFLWSGCRQKQGAGHFAFLLILFLGSAVEPLLAQAPPKINSFSLASSVKEMGVAFGTASASDPDGDPVTYSWTFESDPTNQAYFFDASTAIYSKTLFGTSQTFIQFGVGTPGEGPPGPTALQGQQIVVRLDVSDGVNSVSRTAVVTVSGFNLKPVIQLNTEGMGTLSNPKITPTAVSLTANASYDPDGSSPRFAWRLGGVSGGTTCPGGIFVLFGKETDKPSLPIPLVTAYPSNPLLIRFNYRVIDGMYVLEGGAIGYAASPQGCNTPTGEDEEEINLPPKVSILASTTQADWGEEVTLTGIIDDPGDTHTKSWLQINNTTPVTLSAPTSEKTSFTAPSEDTTLRFRFTARDSAQQEASVDVVIQVSEPGGSGGGGSGEGGSGGGSGEPSEGDSTGAASGCGEGNQPATASVPASYTIQETLQGQIQALSAIDPDDTPGACVLNECEEPGARYEWSVVEGHGLMADGNLLGRDTSKITFAAPQVATDLVIGLELFVYDALGCGTRYPVDLLVQNIVVNSDPIAVLTYNVRKQGVSGFAPSSEDIVVVSPVTIDIDGRGSSDPDGDPITFSWQKNDQSVSGGSILLSVDNAAGTLSAPPLAQGRTTLTLTVADNRGGQRSQSLSFLFLPNADQQPLAVASATRDGAQLTGPLKNGDEFILDASGSSIPEPTPAEKGNLVFAWTQTQGTPIFSKDLNSEQAKLRVTDVTAAETLRFQLLVKNGTASDTDIVQIQVEPGDEEPASEGDVYYPIVGVGSVGDGSALQTVIVIDNLLDEVVDDVRISFYDANGEPFDVAYVDVLDAETPIKLWDSSAPFSIAGAASRGIEFVAPSLEEGSPGLRSGWAHVTSSGQLQGSVRYQLVSEEDGALLQDVGIPSGEPGTQFLTLFRLKDEFALAVANPGDVQIVVNLLIYDLLDPEVVVAAQVLILEPGQMRALFLEELFPDLEIEEGHLRVGTDTADEFILTGLITQGGYFISAQSISRLE